MSHDEELFIAGKPLTDIWAKPGLAWMAKVRDAHPQPLHAPHLRFVRKDRANYDLDNLVYPVLYATRSESCSSVWATVGRGDTEGVYASEAIPPAPPTDRPSISVYVANPSRGSVAARSPVPELIGLDPFGVDEPVGLFLAFDDPMLDIGSMSYEGPTKSFVDDLGPLLGSRIVRGRPQCSDHRVKELRITRGARAGRTGVTVTIWEL